jgi:hypothetical protein
MELLRFIRYPDVMRTWVSVFLIALFAVVHTATAFELDHVETPALSHQLEANTTAQAFASAHPMKCCEQGGEQTETQKASHCSSDCVSYLGTHAAALPQVRIIPELWRPAEFFACKPSPENRPPRQI